MKREDSLEARRNPGFRTTISAAQEAVFGGSWRFMNLATPPFAASLLRAAMANPAAFAQRTTREVAHGNIRERFE